MKTLDDLVEDQMVRDVEKKIQKLLFDLQDEVGKKVEYLSVDTRNFANLAVDIQLSK